MSPPLRAGEPCLLIDRKGRRYLLRLDPATEFRCHLGNVPHSEIIGLPEGARVVTTRESQMIVLRPGLADFILKMKRGPQVIYPKDLGAILVYADIAPGNVVLEAGTGSGALTMALVRSVGSEGRVVSVDRRSDHAEQGRESILRFFGEIPSNLDLRVGDVEDMVMDVEPDRVVLDLPEPWDVVEPVEKGLRDGGRFCAYVPTVPQLSRTVEALGVSGYFSEIVSFEVLVRTWNVEGRSVRPDHRMVGHTGFITVARKVSRSP
jgi:tRNA (adenine57-N1/adenine58-N1)-methyltransferase